MESTRDLRPLFLTPVDAYSMYKAAGDQPPSIGLLPEDEKKWPSFFMQKLFASLPWMSEYGVDIQTKDADDVTGSALHQFVVYPKIAGSSPAAGLGKASVRIPIVVTARRLSPFYVFECGGEWYHLTKRKLQEVLINPHMGEAAETPLNINTTLSNQAPPSGMGANAQMAMAMGGSSVGGMLRTASAPKERSSVGGGAVVGAGAGAVIGGAAGGPVGAAAGAVVGGLIGALSMAQAEMISKMSPAEYAEYRRRQDVSRARSTGGMAGAIGGGVIGRQLGGPTGEVLGIVGGHVLGRKHIGNYMLDTRAEDEAYIRTGRRKTANAPLSLCVGGTSDARARARILDVLDDPMVAVMLEKSASGPGILACLDGILSAPSPAAVQQAGFAKRANEQEMQVLQLRRNPSGVGYILKWAEGENFAPQEQAVSAPQAQAQLPPAMLQEADASGSATVLAAPPVTPDPMQQVAQEIHGYGLYKCHRADTGDEVIGYVLPGLYDPATGAATTWSLFTNGSTHALWNGALFGNLVNLSFDLPKAPHPRGLGIFYKVGPSGAFACVPVTIQGGLNLNGQVGYVATDNNGAPLQIQVAPGMQRPMMAPAADPTSQATLYIPADYSFLPLNNPVQLQGAPPPPPPPVMAPAAPAAPGAQAGAPAPKASPAKSPEKKEPEKKPEAAAKKASAPASGRAVFLKTAAAQVAHTRGSFCVRADGMVQLGGPVFEKVASRWCSRDDALFLMGASGIQQKTAEDILDVAQYATPHDPLSFYHLRPIVPASHHQNLMKIAQMERTYLAGRYPVIEAPVLVKEALAITSGQQQGLAGSVNGGAVDSMLALGFLNPENTTEFVRSLPVLEDAASQLARLVFATQVGYQPVPLMAAVRAMEGISKVVEALKVVVPSLTE